MNEPSRAIIIRSNQKDNNYIDKIRSDLYEIFSFVGPNVSKNWVFVIDGLSKFLYYGLTTGLYLQTLGEEYCSLITVHNKSKPKLLNFKKLWLIVFFQSIYKIVLQSVFKTVRKILVSLRIISNQNMSIKINKMEKIMEASEKFNLALFYYTGFGYFIIHRLFYIHQICLKPNVKDNFTEFCFKIIGLINLVRCLKEFRVILKSNSNDEIRSYNDETNDNIEECESTSGIKCGLCLSKEALDPSASPCGHVFCWDCILDASRRLNQCPLCRASCHPSRIIYLENI